MKTFSMSQAGANIAFPFSVNAPFPVKAIQIDNVTTATIIIGSIAQGGDITIVPPYSARAVLVQDIGTIWISSNGSVTFSTDRLGITLYDSEVQPFVSAYALANGPMIIANQTLFQQGIALGEIATPVNPAASTVDLYAKVDGHLYLLPAGGIEHQLLDDSSALNGAKLTTASVLLAALNANVIAAFAPIAKGVTNGDAHDHIGGDGAPITTAALSARAATQSAFLYGLNTSTTTNAAFADIPDLYSAFNVENNGSDLLVLLTGVFSYTIINGFFGIALSLDNAAEVAIVQPTAYVIGAQLVSSILWRFLAVSSGVHIIKGRWQTLSGGTLTATGNQRFMQVIEFKR